MIPFGPASGWEEERSPSPKSAIGKVGPPEASNLNSQSKQALKSSSDWAENEVATGVRRIALVGVQSEAPIPLGLV
jgi:hypothetical protein